MRFQFTTSATVKRLANYSGNKSSYASVSGTILGFFTPAQNYQAVQQLGIIGQAYEFTTDGHKDIRVNDILTIDSVDYGVQGVARYRMGAQDFLRCTLNLLVNE